MKNSITWKWTKIKTTLNEQPLKERNNYKHLGEKLRKRINLQEYINELEGKLIVAVQKALVDTRDRVINSIKLKAIWVMVDICIILSLA